MLSKKAQGFRPSPTLALAARAKEMKDQGLDVLSLTVGEPDWPTYSKACDAGIKAIRDGKTKYTPANGIVPLRQAICALTKELIGVEYKPNEVTVSTGAKFVLFAAFSALLDPDEEVIIPAPFWASYSEMVELAGGKPRIIKTQLKNRFKITPEELQAAITPKSKIFLLNSPSNPTGVEYSREDLKALAAVIEKNPQLAVVTDDIYNQLSFGEGGISPHLLQVAPQLRDRTVCVNGASKAYSMTGWRIGWATGPEKIIYAMGSYTSQTSGAPCSISQDATLGAILQCKDDVAATREELKKRVAHAYEAFSSVAGIQVLKPDGAFYLWMNVAEINKRMGYASAKDLAQMLIEKEGVVLVPGEDFGDKDYVRISFAVTRETVDRAVERIKKATK